MTVITAPWLAERPAQQVCAMLEAAGYQALFVGGCVRNTLLDQPVSDLDLATDAEPKKVTELAKNANIRAIPTGIDHGTVTLVVDEEPVEVTTFRHDVKTDGRRAVVAYATDVLEDARRRDFTMNALYVDGRGTLVDPLGGLDDLKARHIRFIGEASARIAEDYLRILRFFRFTAWYGDPGLGIDPEGLAACAEAADGLAHVSAERIGSETLKLLAAPNPALAVGAMEASGVLHRILPGADAATLTRYIHFAPEPDAIARLAALGGPEDIGKVLRLSRAQVRRLEVLQNAAASTTPPEGLGYHIGALDGFAATILRAAQTGANPPENAQEAVSHGAAQTFPVSAGDLMPTHTGPALGARLKELEHRWIISGFTLTREELLA